VAVTGIDRWARFARCPQHVDGPAEEAILFGEAVWPEFRSWRFRIAAAFALGALAFDLLMRGMASMTQVPAQQLRQVVRQHGRSFEWLARAGYASQAYLYFTIGGLAALAAFGYGGDTTDGKGALVELYQQPFGRALLVLASIGLFGFALFRAYQAIIDPEHKARGVLAAKRVGWAAVALVHAGLGVFALSLASGNGRSDGGDDTRSATASLLSWTPLGPWLVAGIGAVLIGVALHQLWCAWRSKLDEQLDLAALGQSTRRWVIRLSRFGIAARAIVGAIAGGFLLLAAINSNAGEAKSFGESLATVRQAPFGGVLFAVIALGLLAFAGYQLVEARYRRITS
jgi:hypothetical protein